MKMKRLKLFDIAVNLTDPMFKGVYNGKYVHPSDIKHILKRAYDVGVEKMLIIGGNAAESEEAYRLAREDARLFSTVGVHPTRCQEFVEAPDKYLDHLRKILRDGKDKIVAIGEFGLDYERLQFCPKEIQKTYFELQFRLAEESKLPLFLHMRDAAADFVEIIRRNRHRFTRGVVHSFTGSLEEAKQILDLDLFIGLNGCSLKTEQNLQVVKDLPVDRIMLETDSPWCSIKNHPAIQTKWPTKDKKKWEEGSCVKGRNEPCFIVQVLEVIAATKGISKEELAESAFKNTCQVFFPAELQQ
jgi:TatD DNase family protein